MAAKKPPNRVLVAKEELEKMTKEDLQKCWFRQDQYIDHIEAKLNSSSEQSELATLRESEEKLKQQQLEATRRENILVMRLTTKEQEMQEYVSQIQELKQAQIPSVAQLRSALLDPAVNLLFERMRKEMDNLKARLEETQNELSAWKFTPDSNTGKRLMAKCRLLYQENEELGKMISSGRMAKLEGDLALQKSFSEEMKKSQSELDEFLLELDEDVEGMQSTIYYLQQQLRDAKDQVLQLQKDKQKLVGLPNGSPMNHRLTETEISTRTESDNHLPSQLHKENERTFCTSPPLVLNDVNGTLDLSSNKGSNSHKPRTPPPQPEEKVVIKTEVQSDETTEDESIFPPSEEVCKPSEQVPLTRDANLKSVIVENVTNTYDGQLPTLKKSRMSIDGFTSSHVIEAPRTNDHTVEKNVVQEEKSLRKTEEVTPQKPASPPSKRTESGRGRKRTRAKTSVEMDAIKEDRMPTRKRTRRQEAEIQSEIKTEDKRTALEIDTDTEVQVAQTLAYWASAKQDIISDTREKLGGTLGNGEVKSKKCNEKK